MDRLQNVDLAKGLAITAVVILHAVYCQPGFETTSIKSSPVVDLLYSALMMFLILSGYFYRPEQSAFTNIKKRLVQITALSSILLLVLPLFLFLEYMAAGIPVTLADYTDCLILLIGGDNVFGSVFSPMSQRAICGVYPGYYYVQMVIVAFIFFYAIADKVLSSMKRTAAAVAALLITEMFLIGVIGMKLPFYAQLAPISAAFMLLGAASKRYDLLIYLQNEFRTARYWILFLSVFAVTVLLLITLPPGHSFDSNYFGAFGVWSVIPYFFTMAGGSYIILTLCSLLSRIGIIRIPFSIIGRHSLALLLMHAFIIKFVTVPFWGIDPVAWFPEMPISVSVPVAIFAIVITTVCSEFIARHRDDRCSHNEPNAQDRIEQCS